MFVSYSPQFLGGLFERFMSNLNKQSGVLLRQCWTTCLKSQKDEKLLKRNRGYWHFVRRSFTFLSHHGPTLKTSVFHFLSFGSYFTLLAFRICWTFTVVSTTVEFELWQSWRHWYFVGAINNSTWLNSCNVPSTRSHNVTWGVNKLEGGWSSGVAMAGLAPLLQFYPC